jgi:hypothetical protein
MDDVLAWDVAIVTLKYDCSCSTMKSCTKIRVSGARPHWDRAKNIPVDNKMWMFMLLEFYIINFIGI